MQNPFLKFSETEQVRAPVTTTDSHGEVDLLPDVFRSLAPHHFKTDFVSRSHGVRSVLFSEGTHYHRPPRKIRMWRDNSSTSRAITLSFLNSAQIVSSFELTHYPFLSIACCLCVSFLIFRLYLMFPVSFWSCASACHTYHTHLCHAILVDVIFQHKTG